MIIDARKFESKIEKKLDAKKFAAGCNSLSAEVLRHVTTRLGLNLGLLYYAFC